MSDLRPCPFCWESKDLYVGLVFGADDYSYEVVRCMNCGALGPEAMEGNKEQAVRLWNDREGKE
jgi:uncharacterized Zn finger protein